MRAIDFGFKRSRVRDTRSSFCTYDTPFISVKWKQLKFCAQMHYRRLLPADEKLCQNVMDVTGYISL